MRPFFSPGSNQNQSAAGTPDPNNFPQGMMIQPVPPLAQSPQFPAPPVVNFPNPNLAMAMSMLNQGNQMNPFPQNFQFGFNPSMQNFNPVAAMQFIQQGISQQFNGQMQQNLNFLAGQFLAGNLGQGLNQMQNNPMLSLLASGFNMNQGNQGLGFQGNDSNPGFNNNLKGSIGNVNASQGENTVNHMASTPNATNENFSRQNFTKNQNENGKRGTPNTRLQNHFNPANNSRNNFGPRGRGRGMEFGRAGGRGRSNWREGKTEPEAFKEKEKKRRSVIYNENEVKQWREARRRNFPTSANIEKKLASTRANAETCGNDAELRHQQMKEVLAKQEELGFQAAEVPPSYLNRPSNNPARYDRKRPYRADQFPNRSNSRRGRFGRGGFQGNRSEPHNNNNMTDNRNNNNNNNNKVREQTLLKKLLSTDIKADKYRILQVFRFMVSNSFFKSWPDEQLEFPPVSVKQTGFESGIAEGNVNEEKKKDLILKDLSLVEELGDDGSSGGDSESEIGNGDDDGDEMDEKSEAREEGEVTD